MLKSPIRVLTTGDEAELLALCARDPVSNVFVAGRVETLGCDPMRVGGQLWGYFSRGRMVSACWSGANLIPVQATPEAADAFANRARRSGRRAVSIVGQAPAVHVMWDRLRSSWGPARDVRPDQPLMVIDGPPQVEPDPEVGLVTMNDFETVLPAAVAMFTEEVGYSPMGSDGGAAYRHRVSELVGGRRTYASFTHSGPGVRRVLFKADLGAVSRRAAQVQGVWVDPDYRGRGLSTGGMAAVVYDCHRRGLSGVSLYVNAYNVRAIRAYEHVGFHQVGTFATVLF